MRPCGRDRVAVRGVDGERFARENLDLLARLGDEARDVFGQPFGKRGWAGEHAHAALRTLAERMRMAVASHIFVLPAGSLDDRHCVRHHQTMSLGVAEWAPKNGIKSVVTLVSAAVPPTAPVKMVAPEVFTAKVCAPFKVLPNVIAPLPELLNVVAAPKVTAPSYVCAPTVLMLPPLSTDAPCSTKPAPLFSAWLTVICGAYTVMGPAMSTKLLRVTLVKLPTLPKVKPVRVLA